MNIHTCITYLHADIHAQVCDVGINRKTITHFNLLKRLTGNLSFVPDYTSVEDTFRRMSGKFIS